MRTQGSRRRAGGAVGAVLACTVGATVGAAPPTQETKHNPRESAVALERAAAPAPGSEQDTVRAQFVTSEGPLDIRLDNGAFTVTLNGAPLSRDRIRTEDGAWVVLDAQGAPWLRFDRRSTREGANRPAWVSREHRRIIGVVTNPVGAALAAQLGVEPGAALVIESVVPGGPAERAGVRPWDVIRTVGGHGPATIERLRQAIQSVSEGAGVSLVVSRRGLEHTIEVTPTVAPAPTLFDYRSLGPDIVFVPEGDRLFARSATGDGLPRDLESRLRSEALRSWSNAGALVVTQERLARLTHMARLDETRRAEIERTMRAASATLHDVKGDIDFDFNLPEVRIVKSGDRNVALFPRGPASQTATVGTDGIAAVGASTLERANGRDAVAARLERIERRLERLETLLEQIIGDRTQAEPGA